MLVLHINWAEGALRLWAESMPAYLSREADNSAIEPAGNGGGVALQTAPTVVDHDFALPAAQLKQVLLDQGLLEPTTLACAAYQLG